MAKKLLEKTCLQCGMTYKATGPNSRFCSSSCTALYYQSEKEKQKNAHVCPICGKEFEGPKNAMYCSKECAKKVYCEREKQRRKENPSCGWGLEADPWQTANLPRSVTLNALLDPLP